MEFDIITGNPARMAQAFPVGTMDSHYLRLCWCKPKFTFQNYQGALLGTVVHQ